MTGETREYGLLAEFAEPDALLAAARSAYEAGYRDLDAYTPFPVEGLAAAIGFQRDMVAPLALLGGLLGGLGGFGMQYYASVIAFPLDVGGRPYNSWPAYIPITFELTVLGAALFAVLGMLALNGLPQPYHPVFNAPRFALASRDRFFLLIRATDRHFDPAATRQFLEAAQPLTITEVEP